jgi:hypothetical protein
MYELKKRLENFKYCNIYIDKDGKIVVKYDAKRAYQKKPYETEFHKILEICKKEYPYKIDLNLSDSELISDLWQTIQESKEMMENIIKNEGE